MTVTTPSLTVAVIRVASIEAGKCEDPDKRALAAFQLVILDRVGGRRGATTRQCDPIALHRDVHVLGVQTPEPRG